MDEKSLGIGKVSKGTFAWELKSADAASFEGYASVFGNVDEQGDIIQKGAFRASIKAQKGNVPLFWRHTDPIGMASVKEDDTGLFTQGSPLVDDVPQAKSGMALVKAGAVKAMSVGFITRAASFDEKTGVRTIKTADLLEVSLVPFGANPLAGVTSVKELAEFKDAEALVEALLRGECFEEKAARALALAVFPAVSSAGDEAERKSLFASLSKLKEVLES